MTVDGVFVVVCENSLKQLRYDFDLNNGRVYTYITGSVIMLIVSRGPRRLRYNGVAVQYQTYSTMHEANSLITHINCEIYKQRLQTRSPAMYKGMKFFCTIVRVYVKGSYLLLYSKSLRTLVLSTINFFSTGIRQNTINLKKKHRKKCTKEFPLYPM